VQCGACTVIIGGAVVRSCILPASSVKGEITTLEGLSSNGKLHRSCGLSRFRPSHGVMKNGWLNPTIASK